MVVVLTAAIKSVRALVIINSY